MAGGKKYAIYVSPKASPAVKAAAKRAAARLNDKLGTNVVRVTNNRKAADAAIKLGRPSGNNAATTLKGAPGKRDKIVLSRSVASASRTNPYLRGLIQHEVGHGLGLGHKPGARNLMNASITGQRMTPAQKKRVIQKQRSGKYK